MADIFQIVEYEGDNNTFIWKSNIEDFNTGTQLIVHESQEAIFFMNGQALDLFGPGRHTVETQNIPLVRKFLSKSTNDQTPFHCEIYFINKTEQMSIKWGTDSQVQYMEPTYKFPLKIGVSGEMALRVSDSRKLLVKLVGTERSLGQAGLTQMFRAFLMARVKPYLAQTMQNSEFGIFEVDSHMDELSLALHKQLIPDFDDYGLSLERFFVTTIVKPDGDKAYESFKDIHIRQYADVANAQLRQKVGIIDQQTNAQKMVIESAAIAQKRAQEGYTYQSERGYDVAEKVAMNEGVGNYSSTGIGLGMMGGIAGGMGAVVAGITNDALNPLMSSLGSVKNNITTTNSSAIPEGSDDMVSFKQKVEKLKLMKEAGILSDEEFEEEKKKILSSL
ncbi:SPFH domain-containing protein [Lacrimispora aerotolerans]|uniref:SPFH domain-containing protein n=1 Tax=Lacrimispora aerotolerans TaxID=36832 RepID=UPI00068B2D38|nr:SPFH domain-containing protein [Lacrimispora aerotolerans]